MEPGNQPHGRLMWRQGPEPEAGAADVHWGFYWFSLKFLPEAGAATPINNGINILSGAQVSQMHSKVSKNNNGKQVCGGGEGAFPGLQLNSLTCLKGASQEGGRQEMGPKGRCRWMAEERR